MRYLRDMGIDAELLMFADEIEHFKPENDTWEIEKWLPYIKHLKLKGGALGQFFKLSAMDIRKEFSGYDYYIGCGFTPAYFYKAKMKLDLFTPYCVGIEYTYRITKSRPIHYLKEKIESYYQVKGLKYNTKAIATIDEASRVKADRMGMKVIPLAIPIIYNKENEPIQDKYLQEVIYKFKQHYPVVFSHVSHFEPNTVTYSIKRNDLLIKGFAAFAKATTHNPLLVLFEYGEGVNYSKEMIRSLGIENKVIWLPLMSRKMIMTLLNYVDFGGGELGGHMWGGTGWEFISKGVPFVQFVDMDKDVFKQKTLMEYPPFFNVSSEIDIMRVFSSYTDNKAELVQKKLALTTWFDKYGGQTLANIFVELINKGDNVAENTVC